MELGSISSKNIILFDLYSMFLRVKFIERWSGIEVVRSYGLW